MSRFFLGGLLHAVLVLLGVTTLVFGLIHLSGDPVAGFVPPGSSPAQTAAIRHRFALDRPLSVQYLSFVRNAATGDFGTSWRQRRPALDAVLERLPATLALAAAALVLALLIGVPLGLAAGSRMGRGWDVLARGSALLGQAIPSFWLGTLLILLFAVRLHWLPSSGLTGARSLILPAAALAAYPAATITRLVRVSLRQVASEDYLRTARAKGLSSWLILRRHALRNAMLPTLAYAGLQFSFLIGGAVVIEAVFAYPGIGRLALDAVSSRDLPVIQAFVVVVAALIVLVNLGVDLLACWLDPRIRFGQEAS